MNLSSILKKEGLTSVTIHNHGHYVVVQTYIRGLSRPKLSVHRKLNIDIHIPEVSNRNVLHLGIEQYFHLVTDDYYINYYIY